MNRENTVLADVIYWKLVDAPILASNDGFTHLYKKHKNI
jgi:hypothetical protein